MFSLRDEKEKKIIEINGKVQNANEDAENEKEKGKTKNQ